MCFNEKNYSKIRASPWMSSIDELKNALALKCISFLHLKWLFKCGLMMACTKRVPLKSFAKVYCLWDISLSIDPLCGSQWKYERSDKPVHFKRGNICHIYQSNNTKRQKVRKICGYSFSPKLSRLQGFQYTLTIIKKLSKMSQYWEKKMKL